MHLPGSPLLLNRAVSDMIFNLARLEYGALHEGQVIDPFKPDRLTNS